MFSISQKKFKFAPLFFLIFFGLILIAENSPAQSADPDTCGIPGYAGVDLDDLQIPRSGLFNPLLISNFGVKVETAGKSAVYKGCRFVKGPVSSFGGPNDRTITRQEVAAITGESLRMLNNPDNPEPKVLALNPERYYYAAMRIKYSDTTIKKWRSARLLVINPKNGVTLSLRIVDWGPGPSASHRIIDLSPQSLRDLGLSTDDEPYVAFGLPEMPLGVVSPNLDNDDQW